MRRFTWGPLNVSAAYEQGFRAYLDGQPESCCQFARSNEWCEERFRWYVGWLDARTREKFGGLFEAWGVK